MFLCFPDSLDVFFVVVLLFRVAKVSAKSLLKERFNAGIIAALARCRHIVVQFPVRSKNQKSENMHSN